MAIQLRNPIKINPVDVQDKSAVGVRLPFGNKKSIFTLDYTTRDHAKSKLTNLLLTSPGERINQPLFGDVSSFLRKEDFMLHKFLGYGTRSLKPIILNQNKNFGTQFLWSDAMFIRNIMNVSKLSDEELIKSAVFSYIYKSPDLTYFYLTKFAEKNNSSFCDLFKEVD